MKQIIDLRSDTITRPTAEMLKAMQQAEVGDDVFGDDPTVNALEHKAAKLFDKEAAVYCPSGTMTNQIAIRVHTRPGDEVICDEGSHVYRYEGGGIAMNSGASVRLVGGNRGRINAGHVRNNINPDDPHFPVSRLVVAENTANRGGGSCYSLDDLQEIKSACRDNNLKFHLDGARLFNALVKTEISTADAGNVFDSISICLSKGLGAPVGSLLLGEEGFIKQARRIRKAFGGGMRQAGYLAAAGIYALDHHVERLAEDHQAATAIKDILSSCNFVKEVLPVETNIVVFKIHDDINESQFLKKLENEGVLAVDFGPQTIRFVTHLDFKAPMLEGLEKVLRGI